MILTILDHNWAVTDTLSIELRELLSYKTSTYNPRTNKFKYDTNSLIDFNSKSFYTGLVPYIKENIQNVTIEDKRIFPSIEFEIPELTEKLRDYQIEYLLSALKTKRMIVESTTGSGKTIIMAAILASLSQLKSLVIVPNLTLMGQLSTELKRLLPSLKIGNVGGGKYEIDRPVTIGLSKSLTKLPKENLQSFQLVMLEEAHTAAASLTHDIVLQTNSPYRFGFTGTPEGRSDGKDLVVQGLIGPIVQIVDRSTLTKQGYIADTKVELHRASWNGNYAVLEDLLIVNNPLRNELIGKIVDKHRGKRVLILVKRLDHGKLLQNMFGHKSVFISGDNNLDEREEARERIKKGEFKILIASKIFSAGIDIPSLEVGIYAAGGKSPIETIQAAGRLSRPWNDLAKVWYDLFDSYCPTLEEHSRLRFKEYSKEGLPVDLVGFPPGLKNKVESYINA